MAQLFSDAYFITTLNYDAVVQIQNAFLKQCPGAVFTTFPNSSTFILLRSEEQNSILHEVVVDNVRRNYNVNALEFIYGKNCTHADVYKNNISFQNVEQFFQTKNITIENFQVQQYLCNSLKANFLRRQILCNSARISFYNFSTECKDSSEFEQNRIYMLTNLQDLENDFVLARDEYNKCVRESDLCLFQEWQNYKASPISLNAFRGYPEDFLSFLFGK